jgi:hypothetical protein
METGNWKMETGKLKLVVAGEFGLYGCARVQTVPLSSFYFPVSIFQFLFSIFYFRFSNSDLCSPRPLLALSPEVIQGVLHLLKLAGLFLLAGLR